MKRCIFTVAAIVTLLLMTAGSLYSIDYSIYSYKKQDEPQEGQKAKNSIQHTLHTGTRECLSIFNKKAEWQAKGALLLPYQIDETVCSCMEYCKDSDLDNETCDVLKKDCAEEGLRQAIKNISSEKKSATQPPFVSKATLDTETICAYLFDSALEKNISFTENIPCSCSSYCNGSNISEKVMCANFNFFCAYSVFRGEEDTTLGSPAGDDVIEGSSGEDVITGGEETDAIPIIKELLKPTLPDNFKEIMCTFAAGKTC